MCKPRPPTPSKRSVPLGACAPALAVSGEETKHTSLLLRARCAALFAASTCPLEGHCTDERPLSVGARWWCDVRAPASNAKPALRVTRRRSLSLERRCSIRVTLVVMSLYAAEWYYADETPLSFGARPWWVVTAAAYNAKWASRVTPRSRRAGARSLQREGAALKVANGVRRDALVVVGPYCKQRYCATERPVFIRRAPVM
jgi:hypothetical protein